MDETKMALVGLPRAREKERLPGQNGEAPCRFERDAYGLRMKLPAFCAISLALLTMGSAGTEIKSGLVKKNSDPAVRPQDDLYLAVNGEWLRSTEIPADKSNYGAFTALDDLSRNRIRTLIEEAAAKTHALGTDAQKVGDMYRSFMNEAQIEKLGLKPLTAEIGAIRGLKTKDEIARQFGYLLQVGVQTPFGFDVDQDKKNSREYIASLNQSGLGLPDRDYYLVDEPRFKEGRTAYSAYIEKLFSLAGKTPEDASKAAKGIVDLETRIAEAQWSRVDLRDPEKNYHRMPISGLTDASPKFPWAAFLAGLGLSVQEIDLNQPSFAKAVGELLESASLETWKDYLELKLLDSYAIGLPAAFQKAHFELHGAAVAGIPQDKNRSDKAVDFIGGEGAGDFGILGDVVGKLYVEKYFPPEAKARMDQLVANLLHAFNEGIDDLTWMTAATKAKAKEKLSKYSTKIGYTEHWRDYSTLKISADDLIGNLIASRRYEYAFVVNKLGQPVDRSEWHMTPQTVNAYYNQSLNEIVFPAAILQPPFFDVAADDAVNYGGIGAVIGHEISHGFDDQGSRYDGDGNLKNWWTEEDQKAFQQLTQRLVAQYGAYEPLPGLHLNGSLTLGENIADLSGVAVAYRAYRLSLKGAQAPVVDGLTGEQRFFMGWAQVWQRKYRDAEMVKRIKTDPHSPSHFRAIGAPINSDAFAEAFGIKPGDKMYKAPEERIRIW